jgi:hypothetical protein
MDEDNRVLYTFTDKSGHQILSRTVPSSGSEWSQSDEVIDKNAYLKMSYNGNQLIKADDSGESVSLSSSMDFKDGANASVEYFYDANGNLTKDLNKGITNTSYNLLNLARALSISNSFGSGTNTYLYSADGGKLRVFSKESAQRNKQITVET